MHCERQKKQLQDIKSKNHSEQMQTFAHAHMCVNALYQRNAATIQQIRNEDGSIDQVSNNWLWKWTFFFISLVIDVIFFVFDLVVMTFLQQKGEQQTEMKTGSKYRNEKKSFFLRTGKTCAAFNSFRLTHAFKQ